MTNPDKVDYEWVKVPDVSTIPNGAVIFSRLSHIKRRAQFIGRVLYPAKNDTGYVLVENSDPLSIAKTIGTEADENISSTELISNVEILVSKKDPKLSEYLVTTTIFDSSPQATLLCNFKKGGVLDAAERRIDGKNIAESETAGWKIELNYDASPKNQTNKMGFMRYIKCKYLRLYNLKLIFLNSS